LRWLPECSDIFVQYLLDYEIRFVSSAGPPVKFVPFYVVGKAMRLCAYDGNWTGVEKVLEVMLRQGARPSQWALHASVVALIKLQKVESAVRLLEVMRRKGNLPNVVTFRVLCVELLRRNDLNLAERVYATAVSCLGGQVVAGFVDTVHEKSSTKGRKNNDISGGEGKDARHDKIEIELTDSLLQLRTKWLVEHRLLERLRTHLQECERYLGLTAYVTGNEQASNNISTDRSTSQYEKLLSIPAFRPSQPWSSQREALFRIYNGAVCTLAADPEVNTTLYYLSVCRLLINDTVF
jgi:hypothetical protein